VDSLLNSMVEQEAARTEPAREQVVITPPTAQDLAEIEQMKEQVAESSAAAQAAEVVPAAPTKAAVQEVSVADILGDTADPTPAPAAATPVTAASTPAATPASTAPGSTPPSEPAEDLDFEKFLAEYSGE
jgi:type VI protein secretion system component VasK